MKIAFLLAVAGILNAQPPAGIQGRVLAAEGSAAPLSGVTVSAARLALTPGPNRQPVVYATTAADGSFLLSGLSPGTYQVCASAPQLDRLQTCDWGNDPPVPVAAGQTATTTLRIERGHRIQIQVADPARLLDRTEGIKPGKQLLIGVFAANGEFHAATVTARNPAGRTYSALVANGRPLRLTVQPVGFRVTDDRGNSITRAGHQRPFTLPANAQANPPGFRFTVQGLEP